MSGPKHDHTWVVIARVKHGDRIVVMYQCTQCGAQREEVEHT